MTTLRYLPPPTRYAGADPCPGCAGAGVTGNQYRFEDRMLVDELCPTCGGCGRADHSGCDPRAHAEWELDDEQLDDYEGLPADRQTCPSCHGRTWWPVQIFPWDGAQVVLRHLRLPCGCAEADMVEVEIDA